MIKPLLQCLVLGAVLFVGDRFLLGSGAESAEASAFDSRIAIGADLLDELRSESRSLIGREPSDAELVRRIEMWVDDEVLIREGRRLGIDRGDPVIFSRLVQNMRFVSGDAAGPGAGGDSAPGVPASAQEAEALYREALELGMDRSDLVVRRRLLQQMRFLLEAPGRAEPLEDEALETWLTGHPERFEVPARVALVQVYRSRDRRGDALAADAQALVTELREREATPEDAVRQGDPFLHPARQPLQSERQLAKQFGPAFASAVLDADLSPGTWLGPFESAYGMHAVWIVERREARVPALDEVRTAVEAEVRGSRAEASLTEGLGRLRERYVVEWPPELAAVAAELEERG